MITHKPILPAPGDRSLPRLIERPLRTAILGGGGFAAVVRQTIGRLEKTGHCHLVAVCDSDIDSLRKALRDESRDIAPLRLYSDMNALFADPDLALDWVVAPLPLSLHKEAHEQAVRHGVPCYLEKPPTLDPFEFQAMLTTERRATKRTQVGFQRIADSRRLHMKTRLVAGEFGALREVSMSGLWPRDRDYYTRNNWAGRLIAKDALVLDTCFSNAFAHYQHALLFWCAHTHVLEWARPEWIESELYSLLPFDAIDTAFIRGETRSGIPLRMAVSHAGPENRHPVETIVCKHATLRLPEFGQASIQWDNGHREVIDSEGPALEASLTHACEYVRGRNVSPLVTLDDCRGFVEMNSLVFLAADSIHRPNVGERNAEICRDMIQAVEEFLANGRTPFEQNRTWGRPGGRAAEADAHRLHEVVRQYDQQLRHAQKEIHS